MGYHWHWPSVSYKKPDLYNFLGVYHIIMKLDSVIPMFFGGAAVGSILFFFMKGHGDELFKSFATTHHRHHREHDKGEEHEHYHRHGHGGYLGTPGWYTREGHHHCEKGELGCICTDPSKCDVEHHHGHHGIEGEHHIHSSSPIHHHQRFSGEHGYDSRDDFNPEEFDFEHLFGDGGQGNNMMLADISHDSLSI